MAPITGLLVLSFLVFVLCFFSGMIDDFNGGSAEASSSSSRASNSVNIQLTHLHASNRAHAANGRLWVKLWIVYRINNKQEGYPVSKTKFKVQTREGQKCWTNAKKLEYFVESNEQVVCDFYDKLRWVRDCARARVNDYRYYLELLVDDRSVGCIPVRPDDIVDDLSRDGVGYMTVCVSDYDPVFWEAKSHSIDITDYEH